MIISVIFPPNVSIRYGRIEFDIRFLSYALVLHSYQVRYITLSPLALVVRSVRKIWQDLWNGVLFVIKLWCKLFRLRLNFICVAQILEFLRLLYDRWSFLAAYDQQKIMSATTKNTIQRTSFTMFVSTRVYFLVYVMNYFQTLVTLVVIHLLFQFSYL